VSEWLWLAEAHSDVLLSGCVTFPRCIPQSTDRQTDRQTTYTVTVYQQRVTRSVHTLCSRCFPSVDRHTSTCSLRCARGAALYRRRNVRCHTDFILTEYLYTLWGVRLHDGHSTADVTIQLGPVPVSSSRTPRSQYGTDRQTDRNCKRARHTTRKLMSM